MSKICRMCGTSNGDNEKFCHACGVELTARTTNPTPIVRTPVKTVSQAPANIISPQTPLQKAADNKKTMLGMQAVSSERPVAEKTERPKPPMAVPIAIVSAPVAKEAPAKPSPAMEKRTVLGIPAAEPQDEKKEDKTVKDPSASAEIKPKKKETDRPRPGGQRSVLEMERPKFEPAAAAEEEPSGQPRRSGLAIAVVSIAMLAAIAICAVVYFLFADKRPPIAVQVFSTPDGKTVTVSIAFPEAPAGTVAEIGGQKAKIAGGQAKFDLKMDQLKLGTNEIPLLYTEPGARPEKLGFPIVLRHVISTDLAGLSAKEPFALVNFRLAKGIQLSVEGKPVQAVNDLYSHRIDIAPQSQANADSLTIKVFFEIAEPGGAAEQGQHLFSIPVTKLQIDRPADGAVVDIDAVTCSGATEQGAAVKVNGRPAAVTSTGFNTVVPLADTGEYRIEVVAHAPGKAPRMKSVGIARIDNLSSVAERWAADVEKGLDYAALALNPNAYVGKKVKIDGKVVNMSTEKGVSAFLLYVAEGCRVGARCVVYVVFQGETNITLQSLADVYGTVKGTRAVELMGGEKIDVPAIDAAFVIRGEQNNKHKRWR